MRPIDFQIGRMVAMRDGVFVFSMVDFLLLVLDD